MRSVQTGRASNMSWSQLCYITAEMCQNKDKFKITSGQLQTWQKVNKFTKGKVNQLLKKWSKNTMYLQMSYVVKNMEDFHSGRSLLYLDLLHFLKRRENYLGLLTKDPSKNSACKPGRNCTIRIISAINSSAGSAIRNKEGIIWKSYFCNTQKTCQTTY